MKEFKQGATLPEGGKEYFKPKPVTLVKMDEDFECESREGIVKGKAGDFLAEDGHGGFYPISAEFHEKNYREVNSTGEKTLHNSDVSGARQNVPDIAVVGNGDMFRLLCKASSQAEGWMKSTKAMALPTGGAVVQVTTQQRNHDGSYSLAEAVTFVPNVAIEDDINGGRKLVRKG